MKQLTNPAQPPRKYRYLDLIILLDVTMMTIVLGQVPRVVIGAWIALKRKVSMDSYYQLNYLWTGG